VFPFFTKTKTTTVLLEYQQGINQIKYTLTAGAFDRKKHQTIVDTAKAELSEEANLKGGRMISLLPEGHEGIMEVSPSFVWKWFHGWALLLTPIIYPSIVIMV
jgi:hypothetical protein